MDNTNLFGLVLCGGNSSRMGTDKSRLNYHGVEQRAYVYELLRKFCKRTFLSCNKYQVASIGSEYETIVDDHAFAGNGPVSALLTAFKHFTFQDLLVVGCDYPFVNGKEISNFLLSIPNDCDAAAFYNARSELYEPVLAWYSHRSGVLLKENFNEGKTSLQHFLKTSKAFRYLPINAASLESIDSYDRYKEVVKTLHPIEI